MKTIQLKDAERNLAKVSDSEFIRGFDKNGNSILINKSVILIVNELHFEYFCKYFVITDK